MEYRKICNVCGQVFCYDDKDVRENKSNAVLGALSSVAALANAVDGSMYHSYEQNKMGDKAVSKIKDFNRCPHCGSRDVRLLTDKEWQDYQDGLWGSNSGGKSTASINTNASVTSLIQRGMLYLEDSDWKTALAYFENALDADPVNPDAYLGKMMIDYRLINREKLEQFAEIVDDNPNFIKALRFAEGKKKEEILQINQRIKDNILFNANNEKYNKAIELLKNDDIESLNEAVSILSSLTGFKDSESRNVEAVEKKYQKAKSLVNQNDSTSIHKGIEALTSLSGYKEADNLVKLAQQAEKTTVEKEQREKKENNKKRTILLTIAGCAITIVLAVYFLVLAPSMNYNKAISLLNDGRIAEAYSIFNKLGDYKDAEEIRAAIIFVPTKISYEYDYEYGGNRSNGNSESELYYDNECHLTGINESTFKSDSSGRVISGTTYSYFTDGTIASTNSIKVQYNGKTTIIDKVSYGLVYQYTFEDKRIIKETVVGDYTDTLYVYDTNKTDKTGYATNISVTENDKRKNKESTYSYENTYEYDQNGNIIKYTHKRDEAGYNGTWKYTIEYEAQYIPGTSIKSDTLFFNLWLVYFN